MLIVAMKRTGAWQKTIASDKERNMNNGLPSSYRIAERIARTKQAERNIILYRLKKEAAILDSQNPE